MPSSTSLLEADDGESEVPPPLVHAFAGMGLDEHIGTQSQTAAEQVDDSSAYHHQLIQASHFNRLGTVLDLTPMQNHHRPPSADEGSVTPEDEDPAISGCSPGSSLLAQAHQYMPSGPGGCSMEQVDTVLLYNGDERDDAAMPPGVYAGEPGYEAEAALLARRKSVNTTECVAVPSSEHVAEIVGRQGCKIKALRAKTNTYIKTPVRGEQPVFVVTGRKEDVAMAKREILSAAEHFSLIRASRNKAGSLAVASGPGIPTLPGQTTIQVRVPYRVVGLVVGPKGATIKRIQQQTHTYIVTPSRDKEPVFEVTGMPENVDRAREEIEAHIALRTATCGGGIEAPGVDNNDFQFNGTDVSFDNSAAAVGLGEAGWLHAGASAASNASLLPVTLGGPQRVNSNISGGVRMSSTYRNDSSSSLGSGSSSTDSFYGSGGNRMSDFSPTCSFNANSNNNNSNPGAPSFWFGDSLPPVGSEELVGSGGASASSGFEPLTISTSQVVHPSAQPHIWSPYVDQQSIQAFDARPSQTSQPGTPRLSPTFPVTEAMEHRAPFGSSGTPNDAQRLPSYCSAFSSSSSGESTASSPPESTLAYRAGPVSAVRGPAQEACVRCMESQVIAALVPCGHNFFCLDCATQICQSPDAACPVCLSPVSQAIQLRNM
ncbi:RNA-binding E3 ubiquitin-protein ligase MEX3C-like [Entelurus aequoreus]|uniref:RNA-binding E3 ubiquitin-protein ligase MEX3C-like n=1 Tax=Entelurus aequoreus TaxID=161455 RepID=UPI002B1E2153|nr:RNA-binding E3 ubiquitin-protein ligase MEX3C-like [Entelurus aequoreus]XP_061881866.1 RNA-binding E3 ubiquitin-protein ligase MEX3C-like [Entelurus aequoreus]